MNGLSVSACLRNPMSSKTRSVAGKYPVLLPNGKCIGFYLIREMDEVFGKGEVQMRSQGFTVSYAAAFRAGMLSEWQYERATSGRDWNRSATETGGVRSVRISELPSKKRQQDMSEQLKMKAAERWSDVLVVRAVEPRKKKKKKRGDGSPPRPRSDFSNESDRSAFDANLMRKLAKPHLVERSVRYLERNRPEKLAGLLARSVSNDRISVSDLDVSYTEIVSGSPSAVGLKIQTRRDYRLAAIRAVAEHVERHGEDTGLRRSTPDSWARDLLECGDPAAKAAARAVLDGTAHTLEFDRSCIFEAKEYGGAPKALPYPVTLVKIPGEPDSWGAVAVQMDGEISVFTIGKGDLGDIALGMLAYVMDLCTAVDRQGTVSFERSARKLPEKVYSRRRHYRRQHYGTGNKQVKVILIAETVVHANRNAGGGKVRLTKRQRTHLVRKRA